MRWLEFATSRYVLVLAALVLLLRPPAFLDRYNRFDLVLTLFVVWIAFRTVAAIGSWKQYDRARKAGYFKRLFAFLSIVCFLVVVWSANGAIQRQFTPERMLLSGSNRKGYELHTLELYPYTVFHPHAHCRVQGPMPLEKNAMYDDFDVESGDHGFFIDFDLEDPPAKKVDELRIVLIGGSTAQGFGGQTNDHMLYRLLERRLNAVVRGYRVRVINLALVNSMTYQNFVVLNKWGHALEPDLILSFSGVNDVVVPLHMGVSDCPLRFQGVLGLVRATWATENPRLLEDASKYLPALSDSTIGIAVRTLNAPELGYQAGAEYVRARHYPGFPSPPEFIVRQYVHALQSIKRDFQGIPIVVAFQPYRDLWDEFMQCHQYLVAEAPRRLKGYLNDQWHFRDVHAYFQQHGLANEEHMTDVHLLNKGHEAAADYLAHELLPILAEIRAASSKGGEAPRRAGS